MSDRKLTTLRTIDLGRHEQVPSATELSADGVARWDASSTVCSYLESLSRCRLERTSYGEIDLPTDAIEGRIFDENRELRWFRDSESGFRWHLVEEDDGKQSRAPESWTVKPMQVLRQEMRYYLIGTCQNHDGKLTIRESRYGARPFDYPIERAKDGDRPLVVVYEYQPLKPGAWPTDSAEVTRRLNMPRTLAHRFVRVDVQ